MAEPDHQREADGIEGLDDVLDGRVERNRLHLVEGDPGHGKTTIAARLLLEGQRAGDDSGCELQMTSHGLVIGEPPVDFSGMLRGTPGQYGPPGSHTAFPSWV